MFKDRGARYETVSIPGKVVDVKNSAGAGDVFLAVMVHEYLNGKGFVDAARVAQMVATESCKTPDTCVALPEYF